MWTCYVLYLLLNGGSGIACSTALSRVTPERLMGKITSFYILSSNLIGLAFGPTVFALVSEEFFSGPHAIAYSIMVCYPVLMGITAVFLGFGAIEVRRFYRLSEAERR
jgi:MFS family permease